MPNQLQLLVAALALLTGCASPSGTRSAASLSGPDRAAGITSPAVGGSLSDLDSVWETDTGGRIKLADENGRVRVVAMFYAACQGVCVITRQDLQQIEASLSPGTRERVEFILVTLDPARDTVQVLRAYRRTECLASSRWTLLRGDATATSRLAKLLGVTAGPDSSGRFVHSSQLAVVDESGRVLQCHDGLRADLAGIAREIGEAARPRRNL